MTPSQSPKNGHFAFQMATPYWVKKVDIDVGSI